MNQLRLSSIPLLAAMLCLMLVSSSPAVDPIKPKPKLTTWIPLWENASKLARKTKKPILVYFSGSDWDDYTIKLEKEVLNTDMFRDWADKNVILFQCDFVKDKTQSALIKSQNEQLKKRYQIIKVPTFILMDFSGMPFDRSGYDQAKLRDDEAKSEPKAWIKYLETAIKNKPPDEDLIKHKNLTEALAYGKKHFLSTVMLINHDRMEKTMQAKDDLTHSQQFVRFVNRNVSYVEIEWPYAGDTSSEASYFKEFAVAQGISDSAPLQLVVVDMQTAKVNFKLTAINPTRADQIVAMIEGHLPEPDYNGGWITDYHQATHIAEVQKRYIFICFTSMNAGDPSSNYSQKIFTEIFNTPDFKKYSVKKLVLLQADFPWTAGSALPPVILPDKPEDKDKFVDTPVKPYVEDTPEPAPVKKPTTTPPATTQPVGLAAQNKELAERFNIRGYPSIIVLNPQGQKIADGKYMKGGPAGFIKGVDAAVKNDEERRAFLAGISDPGPKDQ